VVRYERMVVKNRVHAAQNGSLASYNQLRCYQQLPLGPELYCNQLRTITHFTFLFGALFGASDDPLCQIPQHPTGPPPPDPLRFDSCIYQSIALNVRIPNM